jgi:hypothetical protein
MSVFIPDILESFLGTPKKHNESSGQIAFDCPACAEAKGLSQGDGKGNLEVNYKRGVFKCWSCEEENHMHGPIGTLIFRYGTKDQLHNYNQIKPDFGYKSDDDVDTILQVELKLPDGYKRLTDTVNGYRGKDEAMRYLKNRGITNRMIDYYDIGFTMEGKFFGRIIIPSYDANGTLNYFIARSFIKTVFPKYKNPDAEKQLIIFNEHKVNKDCTIYLVEGAFDHMPVPNSIPLLGKIISDVLMEFLYTCNADIVIMLDADARKDAINHYWKLNVGNLEGRIKICTPPNDLDPAKVFETYGTQGIHDLISKYTVIPSESRLNSVI